MTNFTYLSKRQLDMSLAITRDDLMLIVNRLTTYLSAALSAKDFHENSLYLLEKIDVQKLNHDHPSNFAELAYFLAEISETVKNERINMILKRFSAINDSDIDEIENRPSKRLKTEFVESDNDNLEDDALDLEYDLKNAGVQTDYHPTQVILPIGSGKFNR